MILLQQTALQAKATAEMQQRAKIFDRTESQAQEEMLKDFFVEEEKISHPGQEKPVA